METSYICHSYSNNKPIQNDTVADDLVTFILRIANLVFFCRQGHWCFTNTCLILGDIEKLQCYGSISASVYLCASSIMNTRDKTAVCNLVRFDL